MKRSSKFWACALVAGGLIACGPAARSGTVNYSYDEQGRVITAAYPDGACATYVYDRAGNRTRYVVSASGCANLLVAGPVNATVAENSSNNPISLNITGGTPTSVAVSSGAAHGSATASGISIAYTPNGGYVGADSFQYTASNSYGTSAPGTVSLTVSVPDGTVLYTTSNPGAYSYTIPAGVAFVDVEGWGAGYPGFALNPNQLSGGGGGGYFKKHIAVSQGQVITGSISPPPAPMSSGFPTPAGPVTVTSPVSLSAAAGALSSGGTASGGDINTTGHNCCITYFYSGGGAGNGGGDQNAISGPGTTPGGGGAGAYPLGSLGPAAAGQIRITARTS